MEKNNGNMPETRIKAGPIIATVWQNKGKTQAGDETQYNTVSIDRRYKDKNGEWKSTNSFRSGDLPKLALVAQKAYEYVLMKGQNTGYEAI